MMQFSDPQALALLDTHDDAQLDALPFGVVALGEGGIVLAYNAQESEKSGLSAASVLGKEFFQAVAPCTNNFMVAHRFESEIELDVTLPYTFTFRMRPTPVTLRLLRSAGARRMYMLVDWQS